MPRFAAMAAEPAASVIAAAPPSVSKVRRCMPGTVRTPPEAARQCRVKTPPRSTAWCDATTGAPGDCAPLMNVLLVEDDDSIAGPLLTGLARDGFDVTRVATGADALAAPEPEFVLLDLGLPDVDGTDVCRQLRAHSDVPIIVLTARADEVDRVVLLELGADDYLVKPFGFRELVARMRAVARRTHARGERTEPNAAVPVGALTIDRRTRDGRVGDQPLTPT